MTTSQEAREAEVTHDGWRGIAAAAARHGIRYRTNTALMQFLCDIAPYYRQSAERGEAWRPIETAPHACHVLATYLHAEWGEWVVSVEPSPPSEPFTHWQPLHTPPEAA